MTRLDEPSTVRLPATTNEQIDAIAAKTNTSKTAVRRLLICKALADAPPLDDHEFWVWWEALGAPF